MKMLPTPHTVPSIHGLHKRRSVNSENLTINNSVRCVKMTDIFNVDVNMHLIYLRELRVPDADQAV